MPGAMSLRHDQIGQPPADRLGARPAEDRLRLRIPLDHGAGLVHLHEGIERGIDDAARHAFDFEQRLLRLAALGDVDDHAEDEQAVRRMDRIEPDLDRELAAVPAQAVQLAARPHAAGFRPRQEAAPMRGMALAHGFRDQRVDRAAEQLAALVAEHALGLGVGEHDLALRVDHDDSARRGVDREAEFLLGEPLLGHVAAREEMLLHRLRPHAGPVEHQDAAVLVQVATLEVAHGAAVARHAHLVAGGVQVARMDEVDRVAADHLVRRVAEDVLDARAHVQDEALVVGHQDEVERGLEDLPPLLDLAHEVGLRLAVRADVARDLGGADDLARCRLDRRHAERHVDAAAVARDPCGLEMLDRLAAGEPGEDVVQLGAPVVRHDHLDVLPDHLAGRVAEHPFGRRVPRRDDAVERLGHDRVLGMLDRRGVQPFALGLARRLGVAGARLVWRAGTPSRANGRARRPSQPRRRPRRRRRSGWRAPARRASAR